MHSGKLRTGAHKRLYVICIWTETELTNSLLFDAAPVRERPIGSMPMLRKWRLLIALIRAPA
jgi:hypothetical protein